jgi:DNA-directed RNA polymerase subunit K/omega
MKYIYINNKFIYIYKNMNTLDNSNINESLNEDENTKIINENTKTINKSYDNKILDFPYISKYEITRILGIRAKQIDCGSPTLVDITSLKNKNSINIAELEYKENKLFFLIKRKYSNDKTNIYKLVNMTKIK